MSHIQHVCTITHNCRYDARKIPKFWLVPSLLLCLVGIILCRNGVDLFVYKTHTWNWHHHSAYYIYVHCICIYLQVLSGKGGVGKSTVSAQLARGLATNEDLSVALLDIDICGPSIPTIMGVEGEQVCALWIVYRANG